MNFSIRTIIRELVAPDHQLSCSKQLWQRGMAEIRRRGKGRRESGAFLLGTQDGTKRRITRFVYYDDLEATALDTGIVILSGAGYGPLWSLCRQTGLRVVADVHTHPGPAFQSCSDRDNPMVATKGHLALIVPDFAQGPSLLSAMGIYEYEGEHCWRNHSGNQANRFFYIGLWG